MSEKNVEIVREGYAAFNRGAIDAAFIRVHAENVGRGREGGRRVPPRDGPYP